MSSSDTPAANPQNTPTHLPNVPGAAAKPAPRLSRDMPDVLKQEIERQRAFVRSRAGSPQPDIANPEDVLRRYEQERGHAINENTGGIEKDPERVFAGAQGMSYMDPKEEASARNGAFDLGSLGELVARNTATSVRPPVGTGMNSTFRAVLPSRGLVYGGKLPAGVIELSPLTVADVSSLLGGGKMDSLIRSHVHSPIDPDDLLMSDRMFILILLRVRAHGGEYRFSVPCQSCRMSSNHDINIAKELKTKYLSDDFEEPFTFVLPEARNELRLRFLRGKDERIISRVAKRLKQRSMDSSDPSYVERFKSMIISVDGNENMSDSEKTKFVNSIGMGDSNAFENYLEEVESGVDLDLFLECPHCGSEMEVAMPWTPEFFRPATRKVRG